MTGSCDWSGRSRDVGRSGCDEEDGLFDFLKECLRERRKGLIQRFHGEFGVDES
jgi:hypothetical protein